MSEGAVVGPSHLAQLWSAVRLGQAMPESGQQVGYMIEALDSPSMSGTCPGWTGFVSLGERVKGPPIGQLQG